ncbi:MAG: HPr family phosphocarrier protein [Planctomycetota bacterium]|nr:HPr family phosphocarrier protein [Planctomycetota bacterium]
MSADASARVTITNKLGLHARPAMIFVELACDFQSDIGVRRTDQVDGVDGKSIMQMMMLAATCGTEIEITAVGADAAEAVTQLVALVNSKFEED